MTGLPKELINHRHRHAAESSHAPTRSRSNNRFKEIMHNKKESQEKSSHDHSDTHRKEEIDALAAALAAPITLPPADLSIQNAPALAPYLSTDMNALVEKMAATMLVMTSSQEQETTLYLDHTSSLFSGTRITIKEFSTAPKAFNIEIATHPEALHLLEASHASLLAAFASERFCFSVHQLQLQLHTTDTLATRQGEERRQSKDQEGEGDETQ